MGIIILDVINLFNLFYLLTRKHFQHAKKLYKIAAAFLDHIAALLLIIAINNFELLQQHPTAP
jgi:hypothetical protein